jgi:Ca2+:H+ antiporter
MRGAGPRPLLLLLLALGPLVVALDWLGAAGKLTVFVLAAAALIPLAWLIGEATDNAAYYTGPGLGGFLNATFGNAPELIIALVAVSDGLTDVVRASLVGSIVGNLLLVLGFTLLFGQRGALDRRSAAISLGMVALASLFVLVASVPGFHGDPERRSLAELSLPVAAVLLLLRIAVNRYALRRQRALREGSEPAGEAGISLASSAQVAGLLIPARCARLVGDHSTRAQLQADRARRPRRRDDAPGIGAGAGKNDSTGRIDPSRRVRRSCRGVLLLRRPLRPAER